MADTNAPQTARKLPGDASFGDEQKAMSQHHSGRSFGINATPVEKKHQILEDAGNPAAQKLSHILHKAHMHSNHPPTPDSQPASGSSTSISSRTSSVHSRAATTTTTAAADPAPFVAVKGFDGPKPPPKPLVHRRTITLRGSRARKDGAMPDSPASPTFSRLNEGGGAPIDSKLGSVEQVVAAGPTEPSNAGWREVGAANASKGQPGTMDTVSALLDQFDRSEMWRNSAVLMVTVPITWFLTKIGAGIFGCLVVMAFVATYYRNAVTRFRYRVRDDIRRELILPTFATDLESVEWLNAFMSRFWLTFEPALSAIVIEQADAILAANTPGFVNSLRLTTFTLGSKAPRIESVRTFGKDDPDVIMMDWEASFTPNDVSDLTPRELENRVNPKIVLTIRLGKGVVGAGIPILVEDMVFSGSLRLKMRLMPSLPLVKTVEASFLEPPKIDFVLKPIGGDTLGFDVTNIPGLKSFIQEQINANIGPMLYAPNSFLVDVNALMNGADSVEAACGVLMVSIRGARNLPNIDRLGTIDPYVRMNVGGKEGVLQTPTKHNTSNPSYDFTAPLLLMNLTDPVQIEVMSGKKHICAANIDLDRLQEEGQLSGETAHLIRSEKPAGELYWSGAYFPVATPIKDEEGMELPVESDSGLLRFTVVQATELDTRRSTVGQYSPYVVIYLNGKIIHRTKTIKRTNKPIWSESQELFVESKERTNLKFVVRDSRIHSDIDVGEVAVRLDMALKRAGEQNTWFNMAKCGSGRLKLDFTWRPVLVDEGFLTGSIKPALLPCIGVVKINLIRAKDLRNVEQIGKSDPYVKILVHTKSQGRTRIVDNNLNPTWHETFVIPVHRVNETVVLECMDYNKVEKDKTLGETFFQVRQLLGDQTAPDTYALGGTLKAAASLRQHTGKMKGILYYTAEFYPIIPVLPDAPITLTDPLTGETLPKAIPNNHQDPAEVGSIRSGHSIAPPAGGGFASDTASVKGMSTDAASIRSATMVGGTAIPQAVERTGTGSLAVAISPSSASVASAAVGGGTPGRNLKVKPPGPDNGEEVAEIAAKAKAKAKPVVDYTGYHAGVMRLTIHEARDLPQAVPAQVIVTVNDNEYNPTLCTAFARGQQVRKWEEEVCQFATPEIDVNNLTLAIRGDDDNDCINLGKWTSGVRDLLTPEYLNAPDGVWLQMEQKTGELRVSFDFTPTEMEMLPNESITNQGILHLEVVDAQDLPAADNSGTSDPYVVVSLNGEKVHKTPAIKKTLAPVWHSNVDVPVMARHLARLQFEVFDWNKIQNHTRLGLMDLSLGELPADELVFAYYPIYDTHSQECGRIRLRMLFSPRYVNEAETKLTVMHAAESVVKAPIKMATGSAHLAGKAIGFGGHAVGGGARALGSALGSITGLGRHSKHKASQRSLNSGGGTTGANSLVPSDKPHLLDPVFGTAVPTDHQIYPQPNEPTAHVQLSDLIRASRAEAAAVDEGELMQPPPGSSGGAPSLRDGEPGANAQPPANTAAALGYAMAHREPVTTASPLQPVSAPMAGAPEIINQGPMDSPPLLMEPGTLAVRLIRAEDLTAVDSNGLSDPYVRVKFGGKGVYKSKVQKKTLNPTWDEDFKVQLSGTEADVLNILIKDHNTFSEDKDLWYHELPIWQYITPEQAHKDITIPTATEGTLYLSIEFVPPFGSRTGTMRGGGRLDDSGHAPLEYDESALGRGSTSSRHRKRSSISFGPLAFGGSGERRSSGATSRGVTPEPSPSHHNLHHHHHLPIPPIFHHTRHSSTAGYLYWLIFGHLVLFLSVSLPVRSTNFSLLTMKSFIMPVTLVGLALASNMRKTVVNFPISTPYYNDLVNQDRNSQDLFQ
ncbi:Tricalbin-2, partial [Dimargaris cristalligena]